MSLSSKRPPWISIARDATVLAITITLWSIETSLAPGPMRIALSVLAGVFAAAVGFLVHEWSHLAGALAAGSRVHFPNRVFAPLLFHFDTAHNDRRQFLWMSYGGYAGSVIALAVIVSIARLDAWSGRVALALAGIGTLVTFIAEVPTTIRVARGAPLPIGYAFQPPAA